MIAAPALAALDGVAHGFFTREGGHSGGLYASLNCGFGSGDDKETVAKNRNKVAGRLGVGPDRLLTIWQCHSADALVAETAWDVRRAPQGDAIVTDRPGLAIGILTADCSPVLLADPQARVVGAAHAGWKGALAGITDATIAAMETLGARRERILAAIGPTISQPSYEVGPELRHAFLRADESNEAHFTPSGRAHHFRFDLPGYLARRLAASGLGKIADVGQCTYNGAERFFSYRRATHRAEPVYGRQISAIALM